MTADTRSEPRTIAFGSLRVQYDERVLEPRPWTVQQARWAADLAPGAPPGPVLELCAGAGHIGLLTVALTGRGAVLVDLNPVACEHATANAKAAGLDHLVEVRCAEVDAAARTGETFPLVLADPPWVPTSDTGRFPTDPPLAIDGGGHGMDIAWRSVGVIAGHLDEAGSAILQLGGSSQVAALRERLATRPEHGLTIVDVRRYDDGGVLVHLRRSGAKLR